MANIFQQQLFNLLVKELDNAGFDMEYYKRNPLNFTSNKYTTNAKGNGNVIGTVSTGNNNKIHSEVSVPVPPTPAPIGNVEAPAQPTQPIDTNGGQNE